jgi:hypothetical protein
MINKTRIQCIAIETSIPHTIFCDKFLLLRTIHKVGDIETINNTQLGRCKDAQEQGTFKFIIVK